MIRLDPRGVAFPRVSLHTGVGGCQELGFLLRWTLSQGPLEKVIENKASNHSIVKTVGCAADSVGLQ